MRLAKYLAHCGVASRRVRVGDYPYPVQKLEVEEKYVAPPPEELLLFAGMSLGYEDTSSPMNSYRTEREPLESFATFLGFE